MVQQLQEETQNTYEKPRKNNTFAIKEPNSRNWFFESLDVSLLISGFVLANLSKFLTSKLSKILIGTFEFSCQTHMDLKDYWPKLKLKSEAQPKENFVFGRITLRNNFYFRSRCLHR